MLFNSTFHCFALVLYWFLTSLAASTKAQDACSVAQNPTTRVYMVEKSIYIKTSVQYNTSFAVNTDLTVTIDNAPTNLDLITTYTSRDTLTRSAHESVVEIRKLRHRFSC